MITAKRILCTLSLTAVAFTGSTLSAEARSPSAVATDSAVFVERVDALNGRRLEPASMLTRGDRVVTVVTWRRMRGTGGFVLTNPLPARLAYQRSASDMQEVSVDGGRSWGRLEAMRVDGRQATPEDVTHVRWRIPASYAALGQGRIAYAGVVR
ncbi:hypothetical protein NRB_45470 [Novosphingobium sp. 11B]|uniref:Uncharacterized protein n=1 Tax=Novosphingobium resinovorum TaxID=158500 RepID=A0A031K679_9SPHN|nr:MULTISPECIES: hypothetical protein [Sphingomonadaceae]EJU10290.1 hypothetical protein LH128_24752 [Sphingomonas sp. LH128]EZP84750.1 hypothetical protein BV97_00510 [Novosphingobium resinovorum]